MADRPRVLLQLDARRRLSLGSLAQYGYYFAELDEDGVITLTPAEVTLVKKEAQ